MSWTLLDTWIVIVGVVSACACALPGNFLILRRMSMMGDAISHAVLPGLAVAFLVTGSRGSVAMFIGAAIVGVLTALFTEWIRQIGKVEESASMGIVFTVLFAVGLILIVRAADAVDLDPGCVLYGAIELVPLDGVRLGGWMVPRALLINGAALLLNALFIAIFYKELKLVAFDPALATTLGINAKLMHYLLMTLVAMTTVAAFESVGSILVIAMLIVPGATAYLLTERLGVMVGLSALIAAVCAVAGHVAAITVPTWWGFSDTNTAGMMATVGGLLFVTVLLLSPRQGILSKLWHRLALSVRIAGEDVLGLLYRLEELRASGHARATLDDGMLRQVTGNRAFQWLTLAGLRRRGLLRARAELTDAGRAAGRALIRSHRLWETYLAKQLGLPADHLHATSEHLEHVTTPDMQAHLAERSEHPQRDPHGREIP